MNREDFISAMENRNDYAAKTFRQVWRYVLSYEKKIGKTLEDGFTKEEYIGLMSTVTGRSSSFTTRKSSIMLYVRNLVDDGILPQEQIDILASVHFKDVQLPSSVSDADAGEKIMYFKNLQSLQTAIDNTLSESTSFDQHMYDVPIAILYLAWFGLTEDQIMNLKKKDVNRDGVIVDGDLIEMPEDVSSFLRMLVISDGYYQKARGIILRKYVDSDYLIRSDRKPQLDLDRMRQTVYRMNMVCDKRYSLRYDTVYNSGIYFRAYMMECQSASFDLKDPAFVAKVLKVDAPTPSAISAAVSNYKIFKKLFS